MSGLRYVAAALLLIGCQNFGVVKPPPPRSLQEPPQRPISVSPAVTDDLRARCITHLDRLPVRPVNENYLVWHSKPGTGDWGSVDRSSDGELVVILKEEGVHLLSAAPVGTLPIASSVEILVDRKEPTLKVRFERLQRSSRAASHFRLRWRADDISLVGKPVRLDWREPEGEWQLLSDELPASGSMMWPLPTAQAEKNLLRISAVDLAGNQCSIEVPLGEAFQHREWTTDGIESVDPAGSDRESGSTQKSRAPGVVAAVHSPSPDRETLPVARPASARGEALRDERAMIEWPFESGDILAGGEVIRAPIGGVVEIVGQGDLRRALERRGKEVVLPKQSGSYHLLAQGERSPQFMIDADAPTVVISAVDSSPTGLEVEWRFAEPEAGATVSLQIQESQGDVESFKLSISPQLIPLPVGDYQLKLESRDARGNLYRTPLVNATVGEAPPQISDLAGEMIPGGRSRYLLIERGAARGPIVIRARPTSAGEPFLIAEFGTSDRMVLWEVPRVDGEFQVEISWFDSTDQSRLKTLATPFRIVTTLPAVRASWRTPFASDSAQLMIESKGPIEVESILRRSGPDRSWSPLEGDWRVVASRSAVAGPERILLEFSTGSWREGEWLIGVVARDRLGRVFEDLIEPTSLTIDRSAPKILALSFPDRVGEGESLDGVVELAESPSESSFHWHTADSSWELSSTLLELDGTIVLSLSQLPVGNGIIRGEIRDRAGNKTQFEEEIEVVPALASPVVLYPDGDVLPPEEEVIVEVLFGEGSPINGDTELRLVAGDGRVLAREKLNSSGRVVFSTPKEAGRYRLQVGLMNGAAFQGGERLFRVDPDENPEARIRALIVQLRQWEADRATGRNAFGVEAVRNSLIERFEAELKRDPRRERVRRALARLHLLATPPDRAQAAEVLQQGLKLPLTDQARAALLNDYAVISLEVDPGRSMELLQEAVTLDPTPERVQNLGDVALRLQRLPEAAHYYARAFELNPQLVEARERWALTHARLGRAEWSTAEERLQNWWSARLIDQAAAAHLRQGIFGEIGNQR